MTNKTKKFILVCLVISGICSAASIAIRVLA